MRSSTNFLLLSALTLFFSPSPARAWGCKGHQTIALIALNHLTPEAKESVERLLRDNPAVPESSRYCKGPDQGLLAAASTWADDIRRRRPRTAPWHYINIPRGAARHPLDRDCGDRGCITQAIAEQLAILSDPNAPSVERAEALRFIVHLVGDLHMPLHATSNNDLGGNCVPLKYFRRRPAPHNGSFTPNLHSIWDVAVLERDMNGAEPREYASDLEARFRAKLDSWREGGIHVDEWAWESHDAAESVAYGALVPKIPVEIPVMTRRCTEDDDIRDRMLALHVSVAEPYQSIAAPVLEERLARAGLRLALVLNEALTARQD